MHIVTVQIYLIKNKQFLSPAFLSRSTSLDPSVHTLPIPCQVWTTSALLLLLFLLKTLHHLLNKLQYKLLYCVEHLVALFKHRFSAQILGYLYLSDLQLNLLSRTLAQDHHLCPSARRYICAIFSPRSCRKTFINIHIRALCWLFFPNDILSTQVQAKISPARTEGKK